MRLVSSMVSAGVIIAAGVRLAVAQPLDLAVNDRQAVADCLTAVVDRRAAVSAKDVADQPARHGATVQLDLATKQAASHRNKCIGVIAAPCMGEPGSAATSATKECIRRERAAWDERLNAAYKQRLDGYNTNSETHNIRHRDTFRLMQRAWLTARDAKCEIAALDAEGETAAEPVRLYCQMEETARQALWLESLLR